MPSSQLNKIFEYCKKGKTQLVLDTLVSIETNNIIDDRNNTLLCVALKHGHWQTFTALLESNHSFSPQKPLLISACQYNKDDILGISLALQFNSDVNIQDNQNRTALMTSCLLGHVNKSIELIEQNASLEIQDKDGNTALIEAIQSRNKKLVELILHQKPEVNKANKFSNTALLVAIKQKSPVEDIIKSLLDANADPELMDANKKSTWLIAKQKHPRLSRLIEKHLNSKNQIELPFFSNDYKSNPITTESEVTPKITTIDEAERKPDKIEPTISTESTKMVKPLIFTQRKVKKTNKQEWFHAAKTGNLGGLNRMIFEGIDIDCIDNKGCTALIRACGHSRRAVVSFLLQQNANKEIRSKNGSTALSSSVIGNSRRVAGLLLENNADPNGLGPSNYSYATIAAAQWNDAMLSILYRGKSDIFIVNNQNQNLFHIIALAAEYYNNINNAKTSIQFLLDHGLDINLQDHDGNTPLLLLCGAHKKKYKVDDRNIASIVHYILKHGAAPAITNNERNSAIEATRFHKLQQTKGVLMNALSWNDA